MAADPAIGRAVAAPPADAAAEQLFARHQARVYNFCLYRLRDRQEAEDAVQTTFLYAYGSLRRGVVPRAEAAWLLTIAKNVCVARWRSARRRNGHEMTGDPERLELVADEAQPDPFEREELERALGRLPEQQRKAILLREWQGLSYAESRSGSRSPFPRSRACCSAPGTNWPTSSASRRAAAWTSDLCSPG